MVIVNEGDDIAIYRGGRRIVMRNVRVSSVQSEGGQTQYITLRSETPQVKIRRDCLKCGYVWEGLVPWQREPMQCGTLGCTNELGRIEVKS